MTFPPELPRLLTEALESLGVAVERVRLDEMSSGGGLCMVRGRYVVYLDRLNPVEKDVELLTEAVLRMTDANTFLVPAVRDWLERQGQIGS